MAISQVQAAYLEAVGEELRRVGEPDALASAELDAALAACRRRLPPGKVAAWLFDARDRDRAVAHSLGKKDRPDPGAALPS